MNAKEEAPELGLVDEEPRLEVKGLIEIPGPGWNLSAHLSD